MSLSILCGIFSNIRQDIKELMFTVLILLTLVALVYVFIKFEQTRAWIGSLIVFVVFCTSLISGYKIYQYFTATGGTVGDVISSIFGSSNAEKVGDYSFKFNNLVFKSTANENEYKATYQDFYSNESGSFDLDMTKNWNIYINDNVANNNVIGANYVFADYVYTFYDDNLKELFSDTLKIKFVFYNNYYQIDLITNNGETATEFWQSYFVKDSILISLKINEYKQDSNFNTDKNTARFIMELHTVAQKTDLNKFGDFYNLHSGINVTIMYQKDNNYIDIGTFEIQGHLEKKSKDYIIIYTTYVAFDKIENCSRYYYKINNFTTGASAGTIGEIKILETENHISGSYSKEFLIA